MPTPIIESILSDPTGAYVRFRWHAPPCGSNSMVQILEYSGAGNLVGSEYIGRTRARIRWDRLVSESYSIIRQPEQV